MQSIPEIQSFLVRNTTAIFLTADFDAISSDNAVRLAVRQLRNAVDVFNFYKNASSITIGQEAIAYDEAALPRVIELGESSLRRLKPRKQAEEITHRIIESVGQERLSGRVLNALEHHSLAHGSTAARVRLVNLWSTMECLTGADNPESVISRICDIVAPIVVWRRADKVLTYVAMCLHHFRSKGASLSLGSGFSASNERFVSRFELLHTLARPVGHQHIVDLLAFSSLHPLLCNRIYSLWRTFSQPKLLAKELQLSQDRVNWHLCRIYRARNLIIHDGVEVAQVPLLLDNLYYYFSVTMSRILHGMLLNPSWGVEESAAHWKLKSAYLVRMLSEAAHRLKLDDFFPTPPGTTLPIWPEESAPSAL